MVAHRTAGAVGTMSSRHFDAMLPELYRCSTESSRWPDVLDQICRATGARSAVIQLLDIETERVRSRWTLRDSSAQARRAEHEQLMGDAVNPRMRTNLHRQPLPAHGIHRDEQFFAPGDPARAELRERLAALQLGKFMSVGIPFSAQQRLVLVLHRDIADRHDFDAAGQTFATRLLPHLRQSVESCLLFESQRQRVHQLESGIDQFRCGVALVTSSARVRWANQAARQIFARNDRLWVQAGQLKTARLSETANLRHLIAQASAATDRMPALTDRLCVLGKNENGHPLQIMMVRLSEATQHLDGHAEPHVLLLLSEPNVPPAFPAATLEELFGLSRVEARLATALCRGSTLGEYASERGVTIGTARYQLRQVLAKTQTRRQGTLIQQMCSSVIAQGVMKFG
jgi:PAS domain-containing protein/DNA-binding CsgD family transcriptional regulator